LGGSCGSIFGLYILADIASIFGLDNRCTVLGNPVILGFAYEKNESKQKTKDTEWVEIIEKELGGNCGMRSESNYTE
jgi:hypothetical protein